MQDFRIVGDPKPKMREFECVNAMCGYTKWSEGHPEHCGRFMREV